jgi:hypothetical protein
MECELDAYLDKGLRTVTSRKRSVQSKGDQETISTTPSCILEVSCGVLWLVEDELLEVGWVGGWFGVEEELVVVGGSVVGGGLSCELDKCKRGSFGFSEGRTGWDCDCESCSVAV